MQASRLIAGLLGALLAISMPMAAVAAQKGHAKKHTSASVKTSSSKSKHAAPRAKRTNAAPAKSSRAVKASSRKSTRAHAVRVKAAPRASAPERDFDHDGMPLLKSAAFYVQDVHTGKVLLSRNADSAVPIASITKLMTSMVVLDAHPSLSEIIEVTSDDIDRLKNTSSRLAVGTRLSREEMLRLALMASENRAANSLARNYPGGMSAFLAAVKVKAQMMGLTETHIYDPTGLNKNNVSSAHDLAILVANASRYPLIREFSTSPEYTAELASGRAHTFHNTNSLVRSPDWQIDVQKTGFINESGKCLVMQAWMGNKQLAIVLLDSSGRYTRIADANRVRKWLEANGVGRSQPMASNIHGTTVTAN